MKAMKRSLALALALLMMLPLISVPAVAEEPTPTVYWNGSDLESGDGMSIVNSYPSTLQVVEEDNGNHAFRYDAVGVQGGNYSADFYAVTYNTNASKAKFYAFSTSTVNEDGTVSGKVTIEGTEYTVSNAIPDKNKEMSDCKGYALFSGEQCDAFIGGVNVAKAVKVKNPAVSSEQAKVIALEADYYFAKGTKGFFCSRARTSDGKYLELFGIQASGNTLTVRSHENASIAEGANVVVSTDKWFTVTSTVNTATGTVSIYVYG